ncbi:MAG TPA: type II toxin-antitoxin system HipA family toxin [Candidatus Methylacidiphilales bacterium]|jgi:serine/threonine-protein kinase HipA|nr:type II toxin-antitoxin system HipA family toxin [Candidatus Methylacidiphilales bacterium]
MSRASAPALNVRWYDGRLVGRVLTTGPTYFAYADEWLASGHNLSPVAVPFANTALRQRVDGFDQLPGFLSDCLPDQWGRRIMDREFSALDVRATPMRMLAWVGRRGIGALSFEPALDGEHSTSSWEAVTPVLLTREAQAVMRQEAAGAFQHLQHAGTAGGALPKATVARLPDGTLFVGGDVAAAETAYPDARLGILKLDCENNPARRVTDGRLEHAYMTMARASGIRTAITEIITDTTDARPFHHLFVERFDCLRGTPRRFHMVTLAGVLHTRRLTYSNLLLTTRQLTQDQTEVSEAVRRMIFNVRSANADDHGKNHSFLFDDHAGRWALSPAYDLTLNAESGREYQGLSPNTFGTFPRLATLAGVAADAGVRRDEFDAIDAEVAAAIQRWPDFAASANLAPGVIERTASIHAGLATKFASETPAKRGKRRKLWE